jgi:hypothetical protein
MTRRAAVTPSSDPMRAIPGSPGERRLAIDAALSSIAHEEHRLERLGFEWPLARCREQRRYWQFVAALHAMTEGESRPERSW